jgi:hypothetical protein
MQLDRDATLALELIVVQDLFPHLPATERLSTFQEPVGQRGLSVVDVGHDTEVADTVGVQESARGARKGVKLPKLIERTEVPKPRPKTFIH